VRKQIRRYTADEKIKIVGRHLFENVPILELCGEFRLHPGVLQGWTDEFLLYGAAAFRRRDPKRLPE
jgi:transposase